MIFIRAIFLLFCASVAYSRSVSDEFESALIGPKFCGQGQALWCSNFTNAAECNAVKHCIQSVWLTHQPPAESCLSCTKQIDQFRRAAPPKKDIARQVLTEACVPFQLNSVFYEQCSNYVDLYATKYHDQLVELLESDVSPSIVCNILQLCVNSQSSAPIITTSAPQLDNDVVVRFENVILHFPAAHFLDIEESQRLLGSAKCTWGPSYWCSNVSTANECRATTHCIEKVWSEQRLDNDNDDICQLCKDAVKTARDEVTKKKTRDGLLKIFEVSCKLIPFEEEQKECLKLTKNYVTELIEVVSSKLDPLSVCTVFHLCHNSRIDELLANRKPDPCISCTAGMLSVERYLQKAPQESVLEILLRVCDQLSSFSDACSSLVTANFPSIYETITKEMYPFPVCHLNGMCASQYHLHATLDQDFEVKRKAESLLASGGKNLPCDLCEQFVSESTKILITNTTEEEFREMLEGICRQSDRLEKDCLQIVDDGYDLFYKYLTEELKPKEFCRDISLCSKGDMVTDEGLYLLTNPSSSVSSDSRIAEIAPKSFADVECVLCKKVIQVVQKEIDDPKYEHNIEKLLKEVCSLVPSQEKAKCDNFIQVYSDVLIKILANDTDPGAVCALLHLCPELHPIEDDLCPLCRDIMNVVHEKLEDPADVTKIQQLLKQVCSYLPHSRVAGCKTFMDDYSELVMSVLAEEADPQLVCPALKLCPALMSPLQHCAQCQNLMVSLIGSLAGDNSESNVLRRLRYLVPHKRGDMTLTALQLKVNHREDIVDMMGADFSAPESCVFLNFCEADMISEKESIVDDESTEISGDLEETDGVSDNASCEMCELLVKLFENEFTSNATEVEIEKKLQKFCIRLRNPELRSNCSHFVIEYVPKLLQLLKKDMGPAVICRESGVCPALIDTLMNTEEASTCELCEAVIGSAEDLVSDPAIMEQSISKLFQLCDLFEGNAKSLCMKVVSYALPQMESVALSIPSWYYCSKIDMCPYGAHLSFKRVCTKSSNWCVDVKTALLCDQLSHCQQTVWKSEKPSL